MNHEAAVQDTSLKKYSKTDIFKKEKKKTKPKPTTNPKCYQIHWEKLKIKFHPQKNSNQTKQTNKENKNKQQQRQKTNREKNPKKNKKGNWKENEWSLVSVF